MTATAASAIETNASLPPGPKLPMPVQTFIYFTARPQLMRRCRAKFGPTFTLQLPRRATVVITDVDEIRKLFTGSPQAFHAGEGNRVLRPIVGDQSLLILDEDPHLRHRKLLMPAFAGASLRSYRELIAQISRDDVEQWQPGKSRLVDHTQRITLEIILRVVFGVTDPARLEQLRKLVLKVTSMDMFTMSGALFPVLMNKVWPWKRFREVVDQLDELLYAEIRECRAAADLDERGDVLARMARAGREDGDALSELEIRDELLTLLLAGHETTSNGLAWTLHELMRSPENMRKAIAAADRNDKDGDEFLEACFKEALRLRPVIGGVARKLTEPADVAGYRLPAGAVVSPSIDLVQHDHAQHRDPAVYRPERCFDGSINSANWLPFGGGVRRCIGAGFSLMESVEILRRILQTWRLEAVNQKPESTKTRHITLVPGLGALAVVGGR